MRHRRPRRVSRRPRLVAYLTVLTFALTACGTAAAGSGDGDRSAVLLLPGTTGDGGFFDQAAQGLRTGARETGWQTRLVETGYEPVKWQPALEDLAGGNDAVVITGSFPMLELVEQAAPRYPDKKFVLFDAAVDHEKCGCDNVYSITYRYDETGFLAGALAGLLERTSGVDRIERTGVVGVVGGQDIPVIDEYIRGFEAGVEATAPDVRVLSAFAGSFADPVKGKAVANDMIQQGAEILFTAAGATDKGVVEAAADAGVWAIGNAAQQAEQPTVHGKNAVLTASDTNIVTSIADAVELANRGELPLGSTRTYGVAEGAVQITDSALYRRVVPASVRTRMDTVEEDVGAGKYDDALSARN